MRITSLKGQNTVSTADATTNSLARDVVGNKSDTAVTTVGTVATILAYIKGVLNQLAAIILLHAVPTADATTDTNMRDTVGRKTDTANETVGDTSSLMRYQKAILTDTGTTIPALHAVPTADATTNANMRDIAGNKTDAAQTTVTTNKSIMAYIKGILTQIADLITRTKGLDDIHDDIAALSTTISTTTNGVIVEDSTDGSPDSYTVASSASANTFGSWVQIDASVAADSYICSINVNPAVAGTFIVEIGTGAPASEATKIRFSAESNASVAPVVFTLPIPIKVASGVRIAARAADVPAVAQNYAVSVQYYQSL